MAQSYWWKLPMHCLGMYMLILCQEASDELTQPICVHTLTTCRRILLGNEIFGWLSCSVNAPLVSAVLKKVSANDVCWLQKHCEQQALLVEYTTCLK